MKSNLEIYINDHLAGSVAALALVGHLQTASKDSELVAWLSAFAKELEEERDVLRRTLESQGLTEGTTKKAVAWIGEKLGQLKFSLNEGDETLEVMQGIEMLCLSVTGKLLQWEAFSWALPEISRSFNLPGLIAQSELQRRRLNQFRLAYAVTAR